MLPAESMGCNGSNTPKEGIAMSDCTSLILPVVLCGGTGSRLWPLSREAYPKQFIPLQQQNSLFQATLQRLQGLPTAGAPLIVSSEAHRFTVREQMLTAGIQTGHILLEPAAKNTAPAVTLAALWARQQPQGEETLLLVVPSDHQMQTAGFHAAVAAAQPLAAAGKLVIFGVNPTHPETGYGYIRYQENQVVHFCEKPDVETATAYLNSGEYLWNAGILLCRVDTWLQEMARWAPDILAACEASLSLPNSDLNFIRCDAAAFAACSAVSMDYAVMEKTTAAAVVQLNAEWSDLGTWASLQTLGTTDSWGTCSYGDVMAWESHGNYLHATSRLVAAVGVSDLVVVETPDAVLVTTPDHAQAVRLIVDQLRVAQRPEAEQHLKVARPWGSFASLSRGERYQVKHIVVRPGQSISLQCHHHRSEHWVVVRGTARVTKGDSVSILTENESVYIPLGCIHRLENPGTIDLEIIEIQSGSYLGEDDIVRLDDVYGRT